MGCFRFEVYTWSIHVGGNGVIFFAMGKKNFKNLLKVSKDRGEGG
jgi:hypothetical protein